MKRRILTLTGGASAFLFLLLACGFLVYYLLYTGPSTGLPPNITYLSDTGSYKIDPWTILESLDQDNTGIFQLESGIPENPQFIAPIEWTQAQFFEVAAALYQAVWKEPMNNWNLYRMNFFAKCKDNPKGFNSAQFYFYEYIVGKGEKNFSVRAMFIDPEYGYVAWGSDADWPRPFFRWKIIDLDKVTIPSEEALVIAEVKGGMDHRKSAENECQIFVNMNPEIYHRNDWLVMEGDKVFWIPSK